MFINNKNEFWKAIIGDSKTYIEKLYRILSARGFLLELNNGIITVLDNNHVKDFDYLDEFLKKHNIGYVVITSITNREVQMPDKFGDYNYTKTLIVKEGVIIVKEEVDIYDLINNLLITDRIDGDCVSGGVHIWWWFLHRLNGEKVPVQVLETYIARYVKGLSACGLATCRSCDGNHKIIGSKVWLDFDNEPNDLFYKAICECVLNKKFDFQYDSQMSLTPSNQYNLYYKLNIAGEFLFNNRDYFRRKKIKFYYKYNTKFVKKDDNYQKIKSDFIEYLSTAFNDYESLCK